MRLRLGNILCMAFFICLGLVAFSNHAQSQTLTLPTSAQIGQKIDIGYSNPKLAGQAVSIMLRNGGWPTPVTLVFVVTLDAAGKGTLTWTVPEWDQIRVSAPGASGFITLG